MVFLSMKTHPTSVIDSRRLCPKFMPPLTHLVRQSPATTSLSTFKRRRYPRFLRLASSSLSLNLQKMADKSTTEDNNNIKEEKEENPTIPVPPPPEKPLPGDCCGSGCVRCVWDIYYEELDEYQRLYNKTHPKSS